jgi:6-phosphogluconolactonase/glucosamine-6-phosphate isomerase/deaminase
VYVCARFPTFEECPTHAMSLTVPAIMRCKVVSVVVPDARKADAVKNTLNAPISTACPATILRNHPHCELWLDHPSASKLLSAGPEKPVAFTALQYAVLGLAVYCAARGGGLC